MDDEFVQGDQDADCSEATEGPDSVDNSEENVSCISSSAQQTKSGRFGKGIHSLYDICLRNLSSYFTFDYQWDDSTDSGPLDDIPYTIVQDLFINAIERLLDRYLEHPKTNVWRKSWKVFMTPSVRWTHAIWEEELIRFVKRKCKNLQCLCIYTETEVDIPIEELLELKERYKAVNITHMWGMFCPLFNRYDVYVDVVFRMLSQTHKHNPEFDDILESALCAKHDPDKPNMEDGMIFFMQELDISSLPNLTEDDICLILCNCKDLEILHHIHVTSALLKIYRDYDESQRRFQLRNIAIHLEDDKAEETITAVIKLCPNLTVLQVHIYSKTCSGLLLPFLDLDRIESLFVVDYFTRNPELFDCEIDPLVRKFGRDLRVLRLRNVSFVDVEIIMSFCRRLRWLSLVDNTYRNSSKNCQSLECLKFLEFSNGAEDGNVLLTRWCRALVSSPILKDLVLAEISANSDILSTMIEDSLTKNLDTVFFRHCDGLEVHHLTSLLTLNNKFLCLGVICCEKYEKSASDALHQFLGDAEHKFVLMEVYKSLKY